MTANSAGDADSVRAAGDATRLPIPGPSRRSSPDTCDVLRSPTFEEFATAGPVLGKVEGYDELFATRYPSRYVDDFQVKPYRDGHTGTSDPVQPDAAP
jgi:hypothetical protein